MPNRGPAAACVRSPGPPGTGTRGHRAGVAPAPPADDVAGQPFVELASPDGSEGHLVVGLDLGTTTGYSVICGEHAAQIVGSVLLARAAELKKQDRTVEDIRFDRLRRFVLSVLHKLTPPGAQVTVAWEDVQFCSSAYQFQLWCTLRAAVWAAISEYGGEVRRLSVPVGTLKKFATGSGGADKSRMLTATVARGLLPSTTELDDNAIDALWVARWALQKIPNGTNS